jgi:YVTN family beta-propeller protein
MIEKSAFGIIFILALLSCGCAAQPARYQPALEDEGQLLLYLQPLPQEAHRITFTITEISAVRDDGTVALLTPSLGEVTGKELVGVQKRLATASLSPGVYAGISIRIDEASVTTDEGTFELLVPDEPFFIPEQFTIVRRRAEVRFLSLSPEKLITQAFSFTPSFSLAEPQKQLRGLLGFVTNAQSNIVSIFNKHSMQIVDSLATSSGPKGIAIDERRGWVYVALAGDQSIEAIEVNTGEILARARLNAGDEPIELSLSPDGQLLLSANYGSNTVSIIETGSLLEVGRIGLRSGPTSVVFHPSLPRAYAIEPLSNSISVIDLSRRELLSSRILEETPLRGVISNDGNSLYVITQYSADLLVIDTANLNVAERIYVEAGASSIKLDPKTELIYVGRRVGGISVVAVSLKKRIDRFRVGGNAAFIAIDNDANSLVVLVPNRGAVQKLDLVSKKVRGVVEVLEGGHAVAVMGAR